MVTCRVMPTGTVKWFDRHKGWGFITPADGSEELFVGNWPFSVEAS